MQHFVISLIFVNTALSNLILLAFLCSVCLLLAMRILKRNAIFFLVASSVMSTYLPQISITSSLFLLITVISEAEAEKMWLGGGGMDKEMQNDTCADIQTKADVRVTLKEGAILSPEEFEKLHVKKMKQALVFPNPQRKCAVQVCGFTSFGQIKNESFIGVSR